SQASFVCSLSCHGALRALPSFPTRRSSDLPSWSFPSQTPQLRDVLACYAAAAMRGFVIYLMFIAGLLLVTTEAITTPDQGQYVRSEEHTSELQSRENLVCRLLLENKKETNI